MAIRVCALALALALFAAPAAAITCSVAFALPPGSPAAFQLETELTAEIDGAVQSFAYMMSSNTTVAGAVFLRFRGVNGTCSYGPKYKITAKNQKQWTLALFSSYIVGDLTFADTVGSLDTGLIPLVWSWSNGKARLGPSPSLGVTLAAPKKGAKQPATPVNYTTGIASGYMIGNYSSLFINLTVSGSNPGIMTSMSGAMVSFVKSKKMFTLDLTKAIIAAAPSPASVVGDILVDGVPLGANWTVKSAFNGTAYGKYTAPLTSAVAV